jgi:hypothetical protein
VSVSAGDERGGSSVDSLKDWTNAEMLRIITFNPLAQHDFPLRRNNRFKFWNDDGTFAFRSMSPKQGGTDTDEVSFLPLSPFPFPFSVMMTAFLPISFSFRWDVPDNIIIMYYVNESDAVC